MQVRLKNRIRRETQEAEQPFWKKWFSHPQTRVFAGVMSILIVFLIASPYLTSAGSSTTATALTPAHGTFIMLGVILVLVLILWNKRRK
jgi:tetrahydromethanopterin S-methyltransferase subunit E